MLRTKALPSRPPFVQKGRLDVVDVLRFPVVPQWRGTTLGGARRHSSSYRHKLCAKDAIEWSMLRGEKLIACQSDQTRLTRPLAPQRPNLTPQRPLRRLAISQHSIEETRLRVSSSRCAEACP